MASFRLSMLSLLSVLLLISLTTAFITPFPSSFQRSPLALRTSARSTRFSTQLRTGHTVRMSSDTPTPSLDNSDADAKEEEEEVPDTVMSDEDLDARIAELGLGQEGGVEDKSSGETVSLTPIERAQKEAAKIGTTAIGGVANAAITALNAIEQPIEEDDWKQQQEANKKPEPYEKPKTMMDAGAAGILVPVFLVGGSLGLWAIASENNWF